MTQRMRLVVGGALVLAAAVPIIVALALTTGRGAVGASGRPGGAMTGAASFKPVTGATPLATTPALPRSGALVADVLHRTRILAAPGGRMVAKLTPRTEFGSPQTLLVVARSPGWLGIISALVGNGRVGWIPASAASLRHLAVEIDVSLSARKLTVLNGGSVLARYTVAIGRPDAPTPTGRFAVTDRLAPRPVSSAYGCCIIALTAHSPHRIQGWAGGDRVAIHSTLDTSTLGQAASHGCVRVTLDEGMWLMHHIPLGTPTVIRQ
jgi:lipoprotein-anchoring transpeptidase ErfK/SrfK